MAETTTISWCDRTWSPWYGCTQVSMGDHGACEGCYARFLSETRQKRVIFGGPGRGEGTRDARAESAWAEPIRWNRTAPGAFIFPSMCDPFDNHPALGDLRRRFFDLIRATPNLTWLLLTKRPGNIVKLFRETILDVGDADHPECFWPHNAAIGCTVVTQEEAARDIPKLLRAKSALRPAFAFLSMEPLLGPVDLRQWLGDYGCGCGWGGSDTLMYCNACGWRGGGDETSACGGCGEPLADYYGCPECDGRDGDGGSFGPNSTWLDWIITGGETDQGAHRARPSDPAWFRSLRDQCAAAGVPFHFKQWGEWLPPRPDVEIIDAGGRHAHRTASGGWLFKDGRRHDPCTLDGVKHNARPEVARA